LIKVESVLEGGKFTQKLNMVRVFDQPENKVEKQVAPTQREPGAGRVGFSTVPAKATSAPVTIEPGFGRIGFSTVPASSPAQPIYNDDAVYGPGGLSG
jgi:hypothetical protein